MSAKSLSLTLAFLLVFSSTASAAHVYDFQGVDYPSYWHKARCGIDDALPANQTTPVLDTENEFNSSDYTSISYSEGLTTNCAYSSSGAYYAAQKFSFRIEESRSSITNLSILWTGRGGVAIGYNMSLLYVWNSTGWKLLGNSTSGLLYNITASLDTGLEYYISDLGYVHLLVASGGKNIGGIASFTTTDYVEVAVTSNTTTVVLQLGSEGKDAVVNNEPGSSNTNFGDASYLGVGTAVGNWRSLIQFNLTSIPTGSDIHSAILYLFKYMEYAPSDANATIYRMTSDWNESNVTWNTKPPVNSTVIDYENVTSENNAWFSWNITDLVEGWVNSDFPNYGLMLSYSSGATKLFYSSDISNASLRPKLIVSYHIPEYTELSNCVNITRAGEYRLAGDILDYGGGTCFTINASNVTLDCGGHMIDGTDTQNSIGIYWIGVLTTLANLTVRNCTLNDWDTGIKYEYSVYYGRIQNVTIDSSGYGVYLINYALYAVLTELTVSNCGNAGIFSDNYASYTLNNSRIISNTKGIRIPSYFNSHRVYNNFFNNTNNADVDSSSINVWNTTSRSGTNIINNPYIGGNYWATPAGNGFSQTCSDGNADGFCDTVYAINGNNIDYLPLTEQNMLRNCANITQPGTYRLASDIIDHNETCFRINVSDVVLDCQNHLVDGIDSVMNTGIDAYRPLKRLVNVTVKNCILNDQYYGVKYYMVNDSMIRNVTVNSSDIGLYTYSSLNDTFTGLTTYECKVGVNLKGSDSNVVSDATVSKSTGSILQGIGVKLEDSDGNNLTNVTAYLCEETGVYIKNSDSNNISESSIHSNAKGIYVDGSANTLIRSSRITNNSVSGIRTNLGGQRIYNNLFNNTVNVEILTLASSYWNTTLQSGTNIIDGSYVGGNFWVTPSGNGTSQTCGDNTTPYGICDTQYTMDSYNSDYLPLVYSAYNLINNCSILDRANRTYKLTADITGSTANPCFNVTANNITLDLDGHTIGGVRDTNTKAIQGAGVRDFTVKNGTILNWQYGTRLTSANNTVVWKTTFRNNSYALELAESTNANISLNVFEDNSETGINLINASNATVKYNAINNTRYGIIAYPSAFAFIAENNVSNATYCLLLNKSGAATVSGNNAVRCGYGIYAEKSLSLNVSGNRINITTSSGISVRETNSSTLAQNILYNTSTAMELKNSINNTLQWNIIDPWGSYGIRLEDSENNILDANNISQNVNTCSLLFLRSDNNTVSNSVILGKTITFDDSEGNTIVNSTINCTPNDVNSTSASQNTLLNTSFNRSRISFGDGASQLSVSWFLDVTVANESGSMLANATVVCMNNTGDVVFNDTANENGRVVGKIVNEGVVKSSGWSYSTPHNITASYTGYDDNKTNVSVNRSMNVNILLKRPNQTPSIALADAISAHSNAPSTGSNPTRNDSSIVFNVTFTDDGGTHALFVCNTTSATTAGCSTGTWCLTTVQDSETLIHCTYNIAGLGSEAYNWHAFVFDGDKISAPYNGTFYVNHPPAAGTPSITQDTYYMNSTLTCVNGSATDADTGDSPQPLAYRWYRNDTLVAGQTSRTLDCQQAGCFPNDAVNCDYNTVDVHNYGGAYSGKSNSVEIKDRLNLIADDLYVFFWCLKENTSIKAAVRCSSDLSANLTVNVSLYARNNITYGIVGVNRILVKCNNSGQNTFFNYTFNTLGQHNFTVIIDEENNIPEVSESDNQLNYSGECVNCTQRDLTVNIDNPPAGRYCIGKTLSVETTISSSIRSSDNATLSLYWNITDESHRINTTTVSHIDAFGHSTSSFTWNPTSPGAYNIIAYVNENQTLNESDYNNNKANRTLYIEYCPDLVITSGDITFNPTILVANRSGTITSSVKNTGDSQANNVSVRFYANSTQIGLQKIDSIPAGENQSTTVTTSLSMGGAYVIRVVADPNSEILELNESNNEANKSAVVDTAPYVSSAGVIPATARRNDTLYCINGSAYDADNNPVAFRYRWFVNGTPLSGQGNASLSGGMLHKKDRVICEITPDDGITNGSPVNSTELTISNTKPSIIGVAIEPTAAYTNSTLQCLYNSTDTDGDSVNASYRWFINGTSPGKTGNTLDGAYFAKKDRVLCEATPYDGTDIGSPANSTAVEILNSPPWINYPRITPETAYADTILNCVAGEIQDADNDVVVVKYEWRLNDAVVGGAVNITFNCSSVSGCRKHANVSCSTTPWDTENGIEKESNTTTIKNTPPEVEGVYITAPVYDNDSIVCRYTTMGDMNNDTVALDYSWYRNDSVVNITSNTVDTSVTKAEEKWFCTLKPYDGEDYGMEKQSNTVVIGELNTPPSILNGTSNSDSINPKNAGDAITFMVGWSDADGDYARITVSNATILSNSSGILCPDSYSNTTPKTCQYTANESDASSNSAYAFACDLKTCSSGYRIRYDVNHQPTLTTPPSINPSTVYAYTPVSCRKGGFYDRDGDSEGEHVWRWFKNGALFYEGLNLSSGFRRDDVLTCQQKPADEHNLSGMPLNSTPVTVRNTKPHLTYIGPQYAMEKTPYYLDVNASDSDNDMLTFSDDTPLFNINPFTGEIAFTPQHSQIGIYVVNISVSDGSDQDSETAYYTIAGDTIAPYVTYVAATPATALAGTPIEISAKVSDYSGVQSVKALITIPNAPVSSTVELPLTFSGNTTYSAVFNDTLDVGLYTAQIRASDAGGNLNDTERVEFSIYSPPARRHTTTVEHTTTVAETTAPATTTASTTIVGGETTTLPATTTVEETTTYLSTTTIPSTITTTVPAAETTTVAGASTTSIAGATTTTPQESTVMRQRKAGREKESEEECSNGLMNAGEEGVDCGGSCKPCPKSKITPGDITLELHSLKYLQPGESSEIEARLKALNADSPRLTLTISAPPPFSITPSNVVDVEPIKSGDARSIVWGVSLPDAAEESEYNLTVTLSSGRAVKTQIARVSVVRPLKVKVASYVEIDIPKIAVVQERVFNMVDTAFRVLYSSTAFWLTMILVLMGLVYAYYTLTRRKAV